MQASGEREHRARATSRCSYCTAVVGGEAEIFCCPFAKRSKHCLWCGDDLVAKGQQKAPLSFCKPSCSTAYHQDVMAARRKLKRPPFKVSPRRMRNAASIDPVRTWAFSPGDVLDRDTAAYLTEIQPSKVRYLMDRLRAAEAVVKVARSRAKRGGRIREMVDRFDKGKRAWGRYDR
jgi:hypothetical protein